MDGWIILLILVGLVIVGGIVENIKDIVSHRGEEEKETIEDLKDIIEELQYKNSSLQSQYSVLMRSYQSVLLYQRNSASTNMKQNTTAVDKDTIEAIKYARQKSHPDNGGNADDFQKFNAIYNRYCKGGTR